MHFDAHCDTWTDHFGEPSGHGTWVYEAIPRAWCAGLLRAVRHPLGGGARRARLRRDQGGLIWTARELRGLEPGAAGAGAGRLRQRLAAPATRRST
jgi:agmatinase